jgi:subtilase family serine protease
MALLMARPLLMKDIKRLKEMTQRTLGGPKQNGRPEMTLQTQLFQSNSDNLNTAKNESLKAVVAILLLAVVTLAGCSMDNMTGPDPVPPAQPPQPSAGQPDLIISSTNLLPGSPKPGDEITFRVRVRNAGDAQAGASTLRFVIEGLPNFSEASVPALGPGEEYLYERKVTLMVAQGYTARAEADALAQIAESDEGNNMFTRNFSVTQAPGKPDLVITQVILIPEFPAPGEEISFHVNVGNVGNADAGESTLRLYPCNGCPYIEKPIPPIGAGGGYPYTIKTTMTVPQTYTMLVKADARDELSESDECNNAYQKDFTVTAPLGKVDLVISKLNFSPGGPRAGD